MARPPQDERTGSMSSSILDLAGRRQLSNAPRSSNRGALTRQPRASERESLVPATFPGVPRGISPCRGAERQARVHARDPSHDQRQPRVTCKRPIRETMMTEARPCVDSGPERAEARALPALANRATILPAHLRSLENVEDVGRSRSQARCLLERFVSAFGAPWFWKAGSASAYEGFGTMAFWFMGFGVMGVIWVLCAWWEACRCGTMFVGLRG